KLMKFVTEKVPVYYLAGNHDELLRKFGSSKIGSLIFDNKVVLDLHGKKGWFFHGDVFDVTMQQSKWLAKLGAVGYDSLILLNSFVNWMLAAVGREKMSFSKKIKAKFKDAVKFINQFEEVAAELAIDKGYDYVVCGHIHQPEIRVITTEKGSVTYLNSGDWVESLTALEYHKGKWSIYAYDPAEYLHNDLLDDSDTQDLKHMLDVNLLLKSFTG
ncbi:MAG: UDP-2,3-diacylglucosamine diphosphatase, partial [Sphingobacteriales bacterium]